MLDIWKELYAKNPSWKLEVLGDGPQRDYMKKRIVDEQIDNVVFRGFAKPKTYMAKSKILFLTSAYEGFGNVLVEAQIEGVVPVLFNSYGAAEDIITGGVNGELVSYPNKDEFVLKANSLMNNPRRLTHMSSACREKSSRFDADFICDEWYTLFSSIES